MAKENNEPTGRAKGGLKVAALMTSEQKSERARKGALARWGAKPLEATHKGNFQEDFGIDVDCYVLSDEKKTAVISQRGMGAALNLGEGGRALPRFAAGRVASIALGVELLEKIANPLIFNGSTVVLGGAPTGAIHGYDVTLLIDVCKALVTAQSQGKLLSSQANIAKQAQIILNASAKSGIRGLVYALAGYKPEVEEVIQAFKLYVQEEAKKYEQEFPNELYTAWQHLYQIPLPKRGKPWQFMHLTVKHIYYPLAKSNGRILDLMRALKSQDGDRKKKLFQFLNEVGARALRMQIGRVLEMAESSTAPADYEAKIVERFGGQQELELVIPAPTT